MVFRKPADYSKAAVYKCKLADYIKRQFTSVNWQITVKWQFTSVNQWITVKQHFTLVKYLIPVYNCSCHNFAGQCGGNIFLSNFFCEAVLYRCKLLLYYKPPLYKLYNATLQVVNCCFTSSKPLLYCKLPIYRQLQN